MNGAGHEPEPFAQLPRALAPLGYRNYLLYWVGFAASNTGRWIELTGAVWLVYDLTGSPVLLGLLGVARAVPAIVLGPIAGVVVDRVDQRKLLFATQGVALIASVVLGILIAVGRVEFWHVYLQVAVQSAIMAFDASVRQALFPTLVPRSRLVEAVTLTSAAGRGSALVGPAIGGLAIAGLGVAAPFFLNAATFLALMAAVVGMQGVVRRQHDASSSFRGMLTEGLRYMARAPVLSGLLKMEIVFGIFNMNAVMITIVGREILGVGPEALGGLLAAPALGSLVGISFVLTVGQTRRPGHFVVFCQLGYAAALVVFAFAGNYLLAFAALAATGLLDALQTVTRMSIMQLAAPGPMRGRVMANMGTVTRGIGPLAQTQSGVLAGLIGPPLAVVTAGVALAASALLTGRANRALWDFRHDDALDDAAAPAPLVAAVQADEVADVPLYPGPS
jgi:MFS family permease